MNIHDRFKSSKKIHIDILPTGYSVLPYPSFLSGLDHAGNDKVGGRHDVRRRDG
jgi:hypothetical protein